MGEINLDDLMKGNPQQQPAQAAPIEPEKEIAAINTQLEKFTPADKQQITAIKEKINLLDPTAAIQYGVPAQKNIADFSDSILGNIRARDSGAVGKLLMDLNAKVKGFNKTDENAGFLKKMFNSLSNKAENIKASYDKLSVQIERIQGELDKSKMTMLKDITMLDGLYAKNLDYFKNLQLYIQAGEEKIEEMRTVTLPKLRQQAASSNDPMAIQVVNDFENTVNRFEKEVHDLKISKTIAVQTAPQIRLIQNNDKALVDQVQNTIYNTIPLWKSQMVIAVGLANQQKVLDVQRSVNDATNELLRRNSEMLKQNTLETARENERGIVDIETVQQVNDNLIATIEETLRIQQEGRMRRQAAEQQLMQIEDRLKQVLLSSSRNSQ